MLFSVQSYIEDYLRLRNIVDVDGYGLRFARIYFYYHSNLDAEHLLRKLISLKTVLFRNNRSIEKQSFVPELVLQLNKKFGKLHLVQMKFPGGVQRETRLLVQSPKITINKILDLFKSSVESRGIDGFWISRKKNKLHPKPEKIAQSLLGVFCKGVLASNGDVLREFLSGTGFVDAAIIISSTIHLIEIKMMTSAFYGPEQLEEYMRLENKKKGTLIIFDALEPGRKKDIPSLLYVSSGVIRVIVININPAPPSSLNIAR